MRTKLTRALIVIAVAAMLSPTGMATWSFAGAHEPDNSLDDPSFMWSDPPAPGEDRVYFNVYTGGSVAVRGMTQSPNVAALETDQPTYALESEMALLGVWKDCNGDGYVGLAESALREYPAALLLDNSVCPPVTGPIDTWTEGAHNYNGWVSEYVPIAGPSVGISGDESDLRVYRDPEVMVWGDAGKPTDGAEAGGSCPLAPQPRGTYQSTGGAINYVDCLTGLMEAYNTPFFGRRVAGIDVPGIGNDLGLAFQNDDDARGTIFDVPTFGTEDSSRSFVYVADCDSDPLFALGPTVNDTTGDDGTIYDLVDLTVGGGVYNFTVPALDPQTGDPTTGTLPATYNETNEDFNGDCDTSNDAGHDFYGNNVVFYVGETDFNAVSNADKRSAGYNFQFQNWGRGGDVLGARNITEEGDAAGQPVPAIPWPTLPMFGGYSGMGLPATEYSNWNSGTTTTNAGVPGRFVRTDLNEGTAGVPDATWFTWFAHVGSATVNHAFSIPAGRGEYGSTQCGENESGIHAGWNCDASLWYLNADGTPTPEPAPRGRPGSPYEFRDVDCQDGGNNLDVPTSPAGYGENACA